MSHTEHIEPIFRTSPERTAKMMAIVLGICVVGGTIFFGMWDYWTSVTPAAGRGPVSEVKAPAAVTGKEIPVSLAFVESSDFRTLAFNALPEEEGHNPEIQANVGDKIVFNVVNNGKSFHAFGVVSIPEEGSAEFEHGTYTPFPGSEIRSPSNPLKPGESGQSQFIPSEEGTYYYICTVPGHREQGMQGKIIVGPKQSSETKAVQPTGVSHNFELNFVESSDFRTLAFNALPEEEGHNPEIRITAGDSVTIKATNTGKSFHAFGVVTNPEDPNSLVWNSVIQSATNPLKPGESGEVTFTTDVPGTYYYICTVPGHSIQGMQGKFIVE
ncbi:MAG: multicopper oxidase domain-containing protein [Nitrosopumilales archaeon]|nr:multicopper oxidase domain-containing protein [Nitrosopumilales archaeon]